MLNKVTNPFSLLCFSVFAVSDANLRYSNVLDSLRFLSNCEKGVKIATKM